MATKKEIKAFLTSLRFIIGLYFSLGLFLFIDVGFSHKENRRAIIVEIPYNRFDWFVTIDISGRKYQIPCTEEYYKSAMVGDTIDYYQKIGYITGVEWNKTTTEERK